MKYLTIIAASGVLLASAAFGAAPAQASSAAKPIVEMTETATDGMVQLAGHKHRRHRKHKAHRKYRWNRHYHAKRRHRDQIKICRFVPVYDYEGRQFHVYRCFLKRRHHRH